jgi:hypothetical protein
MTSVEKKSKKQGKERRLQPLQNVVKLRWRKHSRRLESTSRYDGASYSGPRRQPGARIIGIDPGRTNIMVTAELVDGKLVSFV